MSEVGSCQDNDEDSVNLRSEKDVFALDKDSTAKSLWMLPQQSGPPV
mgnify:CR=1 FL=1